MAVTKVLARNWKKQVKSGGNYLEIRGISSLTFANSKQDTDITDFESGGWGEHIVASRGATVTLEGFYMESSVATAASLETTLVGANNDMLFTCINTGAGGNAITIVYINPGGTGALSVDVTGNVVTVTLAVAAGVITSTAALVKAAIEAAADPTAGELVITYPTGNTGAGVVTAMAVTNLAGGDTTGARDPGQARVEALQAGFGASTGMGAFRFVTPGGKYWSFSGIVTLDGPGGDVNAAATWKVTIQLSGAISIT